MTGGSGTPSGVPVSFGPVREPATVRHPIVVAGEVTGSSPKESEMSEEKKSGEIRTHPLIKLTPRIDGIDGECQCGTKLEIPISSAKRFGVIWCPCGAIQTIEESLIDEIQKMIFSAYLEDVIPSGEG
jgi:hypothetical protein